MSSEQQSGPLADEDIYALREWIAETATSFVLYGVYATLSLLAIYFLITHNIHNRGRLVLLFITIFMLLCTTAYLVLSLEFIAIQIPLNSFHPPDPVSTGKLISRVKISANFLERTNFLVNDGIVIWRAWILYPRNLVVKLLLGFLGIATAVCTLFDAASGAVQVLNNAFDVLSGKKTLLVLIIPLMVTNVFATSLIGYKAWCHRRDIQRNIGTSTDSSSEGVSVTKVQKILLILVESGLVYIGFWIAGMFLTIFGDSSLLSFQVFLASVLPYVSALYPVLIILLVALENSKEEAEFRMSLSHSMRFASAHTPNVGTTRSGIETRQLDLRAPTASTGSAQDIDLERAGTKKEANFSFK